jgi:FdhD protein
MRSTASPLVRQFEIKRVRSGKEERYLDSVANEEPLEIRLSYWFKEAQVTTSLAVTMRTPGSDTELAVGLLLSEGIIRSSEDILAMRPLGTEPSDEILVELAPHVDVDAWRLARNSFVTASCGICGKRTRDTIAAQLPARIESHLTVKQALLADLPDALRSQQKGFAETGGLHAAALVDASGEIEAVFEDIGRHNALDKLIGECVLNGRTPLSGKLLFLSSRSSFELVQKAAMAGASILATVGGPSSLAIEAARDYGLTLIGFLREGGFNIYSGEWRISL